MSEDVVHIRLLGYPLDAYLRSRVHLEELIREFQLVEIGRAEAEAEAETARPVPARLLELIDQLTHQHSDQVEAIDATRSAAIARDLRTLDLEYDAPVVARARLVQLLRLLDECDNYCRSDDFLLTLATPPDLVAFRRWNIGEVIAQIDGAAPTPYAV